MLCAVFYASSAVDKRPSRLPIIGYLLIYVISVVISLLIPRWVDLALPVGQWVAFAGLLVGTRQSWPRWFEASDLKSILPAGAAALIALVALALPEAVRTPAAVTASLAVILVAVMSMYLLLRAETRVIGEAADL
jgi:hypothetical protein